MNKVRQRLLLKIAGRIKVEDYYKTISEITNMVQSFKDSKRHYDIQGENSVKAGTVNFDFQGRPMAVDIYIACSPNLFFEAGFDNNIVAGNAKLVVNLESFKYYDYIADKLTPYITHEFTHYLEALYSPTQQQTFTPTEYSENKFQGFYGECLKAIQANPTLKVDFGNMDSLKGLDIQALAKHNALKFIKSKEFVALATQYSVTVDKEVIGKIIKMVQSGYIEDLNFYIQTGGDPFGMDPDKKLTKEVKEQSRKIYYNSDTEVAGHLNQILAELKSDIKLNYILIDLIKGKKTISKELPAILELSKTFRDIKKELTEKNLLVIYKEVAKYLLENSQKKKSSDLAGKIGFELTAPENVVLRYLEKLYDENPEKLSTLVKDKAWTDKNMKPLMYFKYKINMWNTLSKLKSQLAEFDTAAE